MKPRLRLVKGNRMPPQEPDGLDTAIERFILAKAAITDHTLHQYKRILYQYRDLSPDWPPTPEGIAGFIGHLKERQYEPHTAHTYYSVLRNFIKFCLKRRLINDDPLDGISSPRRPGSLPRAPLPDDLKKLFAYLENEVEKVISEKKPPYDHWGWHKVRNLAVCSLLLDCGLRVSEAINVRLVDVDLEKWTVFVERGKGNKDREVPLGRTSRADLKLWLNYRSLIPIGPDDPGREYLFVSHRRGWVQMSPAHVDRTLGATCKRLGIVHITPHQLRHAFASLSHAGGAPLGVIQQLMGHSEATTTTRYLMIKDALREHLKSSPRDHQV